MILTGDEILREMGLGNIVIKPFSAERLGTNSVDLCIGNKLLCYDAKVLDCRLSNSTHEYIIEPEGFILNPFTLYLASTYEYTETVGLVPIIYGKSGLGRLGVSIHQTAGFGDIGFKNHWTLQLTCIHPVRIYPYQKICQVAYYKACGNIPTEDYSKRTQSNYSAYSDVPVASKFITIPALEIKRKAD